MSFQDIDAKTFYSWFKEALKLVPPNSVIVIDNASIHNKREAGTPQKKTLKADMINWLIEKNVDFPPDALKDDIWDIIKEHLKTCPEYSIDKLVQKIRPDVTLERLPPYHVCTFFDEKFYATQFFFVKSIHSNVL